MTVVEENDEIVVRFSKGVNLDEIQKQLDYIRFKEITAKSKATQEDVDTLAAEVNKAWWEKNKSKYFPAV
ncbi:hypothetical protein [Mucilaginibacter sp.]|uniref:hypothetical protein n=1 Tax=Mucilaginibacter sp. TaxID=1882438 RepID=UPI0032677AD2